jgi:uncharacterized protein (DUF1800 family)
MALAKPMGEGDARHLLNRTGFGAPPASVAAYARLSREQAVERLLASARTAPTLAPPELSFGNMARIRSLGEEEKQAALREEFRRGAEMRAWWLQEMIATPSPLTERMTLFWHNHFVSSQQKVKSGKLMLDQNLLLRRYALGNFGEMLHAVGKDPAMLVYLDAASNRKGQPNENFAREVMELFTLGEGRYTEADIKEAARAFTGWSIDRENGSYRWRPFLHDDGVKTVLGKRGNHDGDAVLDILLAQPATAEFISAKLWREFVSLEPDAAQLKRIAQHFRDSRYDIRAALRALLATPAFWAPENRGALVKSPVDLVVGSVRTLEMPVTDALPLAFAVRQLGQDLFAPPNVRGWPGGEAWIDSSTLLARRQFIERLLRSGDAGAVMRVAEGDRRAEVREAFGKGANRLDDDARRRMLQAAADLRFDARHWLARHPDAAAVERALLPVPPVGALPPGPDGIALVRAVALDPAYQLK